MSNKDCKNCDHLEYEHDEQEYSSKRGRFVCGKRDETEPLKSNLQRDSYLSKSKVCFEQK